MKSEMKQESGDNSQNVQIAGNISIGISSAEARQIALDVFKANFYEFSEKAAQKALKRAEEITDNFVKQFYQKIPQFENKLQDPSIQSSLFEAQKEYAKSGDEELKEQLLELLIQRISSDERSLKQIVLDEAISILPKLTKEQINILTLIFSALFVSYKHINDIQALREFIDKKIIQFYPEALGSFSFFTHMQFTGCCTLLSEGSSYKPLEQIFRFRFKALFVKGFSKEQLTEEFGAHETKLHSLQMRCLQNPSMLQFNPLNDAEFKSKITELELGDIGNKAMEFQDKFVFDDQEIKDFIIAGNPRMESLFNDWKEKDFKTIRPTSVGLVIAIMNFNRITGANIEFGWYI